LELVLRAPVTFLVLEGQHRVNLPTVVSYVQQVVTISNLSQGPVVALLRWPVGQTAHLEVLLN
jgi:hypothetical protein